MAYNLKNVIFGVSLNLLLSCLSYFIPKNKNQILLGSNYGYEFSGNSKFFYLYLINKEKKYFDRIFWITRNRKIYSKLKKRKMPVIYLYSFEGFIAILRSRFLITTHTIRDVSYLQFLSGRFSKIQTAHGLPLKGLIPNLKNIWPRPIGYFLFRRERLSYKVYVVSSEYTKQYAEKNYDYYKHFEILGYPRNDSLFSSSYEFENYESKFNLNFYEKVIIYCPTFRDNPNSKVPFTEDFLNILNDYLVKNNFIFLIKQHSNTKNKFQIRNFSNIIDVSEIVTDVQNLLIHTDILITDYSSIVLDFLLLYKPVIFYPYDYAEYSRVRPWKFDYYNTLPGPFVKNQQELLDHIQSIEEIFNRTDYKEKFESFRNKFHKFKEGKSSERLYNYLVSENC